MIKVVCFLAGILTGLAINTNHCITPNVASLSEVRVVVKPETKMDRAQLDAWAETARFGKLE